MRLRRWTWVTSGLCLLFLTCLLGSQLVTGQDQLGEREWVEDSILVGEQTRWFRVYVPAAFAPNQPLVLLLHGGGQSMRKMVASRAGGTRTWINLADRDGFLLVAPNAVNARTGDTAGDAQNWNDMRSGFTNANSEADDVAFLNALLDHLQTKYPTDPQRQYVTGASNGGMMTYRLLVETPQRFAAAAVLYCFLARGQSAIENASTADAALYCQRHQRSVG